MPIESNDDRRMVSFLISTELLEKLLQLPESCKIVIPDPDSKGSIRLFVKGPEFAPVDRYEAVPLVVPRISETIDGNGQRSISWDW